MYIEEVSEEMNYVTKTMISASRSYQYNVQRANSVTNVLNETLILGQR